MSKFTEPTLIPGHKNVFSVRKGAARHLLIRMKDKKLAIISAIKQPDEYIIKATKDIGDIAYIIAPNIFHHLGIKDYMKAFPKAKVYAPTDAIEKLNKKLSLKLLKLDEISKLMPTGVKIIIPEGLKSGEMWLYFKTKSSNSLFVIDSFAGGKGEDDFEKKGKALLRGVFKNMCLKDKEVHLDWIKTFLDKQKVDNLLPCHGAGLYSKKMNDQLVELIKGI